MITGNVNYKYQPFVSLVIRGPGYRQEEIRGLVDTGYNGSLLPQDIVDRLQLAQVRQNAVTLADNQPLLGMSLVLGHRIVVDIVDGGVVTIERHS